jgi:putative DNA primase/helicase
LAEYVSSAVRGGRGADGLIQRLQICVWPDSPREYRHVDQWPDNDAQQALREVFERLADLDCSDWGRVDEDETNAIPWVRFDADAQHEFDSWYSSIRTRTLSGDLPEAFEDHLSKYQSLMPSIALILHLATGGSGPVSAAAASLAVRWCEYLESHAHRVYAMATCPERQVALPLLRRLIEWPKDEPIRVRSIRGKNWSGLNEKESIEAALELLMDAGWVQSSPHRSSSGGRPTIDFEVHPEGAKILDTLRGSTSETTETPSKPGFGGFDGGGLAGVEIISKDAGRIRGVIE